MRTEEACQAYWNTSLAWNGRSTETLTYVNAQFRLLPLYVNQLHSSLALARQAECLSNQLVVNKPRAKPRKMPKNVVQLPVAQKKAVAA